MRRFASFILVCALVASCFGRKPVQPAPAGPALKDFPTVTVPGVITDPSERAAWLAEHFWEAFEKASDLDSASFEQAVGTWTSLLDMLSPSQGSAAVAGLAARLDVLPQEEAVPVLEKVEKYLYDPNSPVRNEDLFGHLAGKMAASEATPDSLRTHYAYLAEKCALNAVGTKAADFLFTQNGRVRSLYSVEGDKILLIFGNPECTACRELHAALDAMEGIPEMIASGKLALVEVNPDEDAIAKAETDKSYHIRAIPSMYLLDADKTVLLKDAPAERILTYLQNDDAI